LLFVRQNKVTVKETKLHKTLGCKGDYEILRHIGMVIIYGLAVSSK
jgi:hypothetical protein